MARFNESDLETALVESLGMTGTAANETVNFIKDKIRERLAAGDVVSLNGLVTFEPYVKQATTKVNPRTGEPVEVPEKNWVRATVSKSFLKTLN